MVTSRCWERTQERRPFDGCRFMRLLVISIHACRVPTGQELLFGLFSSRAMVQAAVSSLPFRSGAVNLELALLEGPPWRRVRVDHADEANRTPTALVELELVGEAGGFDEPAGHNLGGLRQ